jgi:hypothetical protein
MNQNIEGISSVNPISSNFYSQVRTRSVIESDFIYDQKYQNHCVDKELSMDFSRILGKPYFIKNINWVNTSATGSILGVIKIPLDIFNNALAKIPFESSTLYRAKLSMLLQVAGTPMHQGCVLASSLPIGYAADPTFVATKAITNTMMAAPHVFLNANEQTSTRLRIPFYVNSVLAKTDLDKTTFNPNFTGTNYAELLLMVLNPLVTPTNGSTTVSISVHVVFDDMEFFVPHTDVAYAPIPPPPPSFEAQGILEGLKTAATRAIDSTFTTVRKLSGDILDTLRSGIRQYTGLHSPNNPFIQQRNYVQSRNPANTTDNPVYFDKMDNFSNHDRICKDFIFETAQDEMDIKYLGRKPQYLGTFAVKTTDTTGVLCWSRPITPAQTFNPIAYVNSEAQTINTASFDTIQQILWYLSKYWRGSINIHFQSVMTNFHFCKLAVARDYSVRYPGLTSYPTFESIPNLMTEFMEFSAGGQIQTVTMPYVSPLTQQPVATQYALNASEHGMYYVYLNQPLISNGTVPLSIAFNVYISLGDDFEFFGYSTNPMRIFYPNPLSVIPANRGLNPIDAEKPIEKEEKPLIEFSAQASAAVPVSDQGDLTGSPFSSADYPAVDFRPLTNMRDHMRRFYKVFRKGFTPDDLAGTGGLVVLNVATLLGQSSPPNVQNSVASTLEVISNMYLGASGGGKFKVVVTGNSVSSAWYVPPTFVQGEASGDAYMLSCIPVTRETEASTVKISRTMYQNLTTFDSAIDSAFSIQCPTVERPNYAVSGTQAAFAFSSGANVNYVPESTSIIEFEIPNMSPFKFYGDISKVSQPANVVLDISPTTNLGHIVLFIPPMAQIGATPVGANIAVYAAYDDVARMGYQVFVPNVVIPASATVAGPPVFMGTTNYPPAFTVTGPRSIPPPTPTTPCYWNYYTKTV